MKVTLEIDGKAAQVEAGLTILAAVQQAGIYIPALCYHPDMAPFSSISPSSAIYHGSLKKEGFSGNYHGCELCLVEIEGEGITTSCNALVREGIVVRTSSPEIKERRQENLGKILSNHPHTCLSCPQREGCDFIRCSSNVPDNERCCTKSSSCELKRVSEYVGLKERISSQIWEDVPAIKDDPLFTRNYNLCIGCTRCVRMCNEVLGVGALGFTLVGERIVVGTIAPTLRESGCKFCTACVEVCPTGALMDKAVRPETRKQDIVPCKYECPAHIDVPGYVRLVAEDKVAEADALIYEKVPFPGVLGRVCSHPCEGVCRRGEVNEPIAICALKRYVAESAKHLRVRSPRNKDGTGKRIAVVGAGPAGLSAAYYLSLAGHDIVVFDQEKEAGGMMRWAIPEYRLPKSALNEDLRSIWKAGISFVGGKKVALKDLRGLYDAVYVATGTPVSRQLTLEGNALKGVLWGLDFLKAVKEGNAEVSGTVFVIGGGNVAIDVALSAKRLGAKDIQMACLESWEEMPVDKEEREQALEEGVKIHTSWGPKKVKGAGGQIQGVEMKRCTAVFDAQKRFSPTYNESETTIFNADTVIFAIGQAPDPSVVSDTDVQTDRGLIKVDANGMTSMHGVFAGGDCVTGPWTVVHAVSAGRKAAASIDRFLGGKGDIDAGLFQTQTPALKLNEVERFAYMPRTSVPKIDLAQRIEQFREVVIGYDKENAIKEAKRCLRCDVRLSISPPVFPPEKWIALSKEHLEAVPELEGVFQLFDGERNALYIKGTVNLRKEIEGELEHMKEAKYFTWEEYPMYTKRESELLQQFMQQHGGLPKGNTGVDDDLFDLLD